jgi:hypothetical protein
VSRPVPSASPCEAGGACGEKLCALPRALAFALRNSTQLALLLVGSMRVRHDAGDQEGNRQRRAGQRRKNPHPCRRTLR